jgi:hypothetical protein
MTLAKPFVADSLYALLRLQIETPPRPPRQLRPDLPADVEGVILAALAKRQADRFAVAPAMSLALQAATATLPPEQWAPLGPSTIASWAGSAPSWTGRPSQQQVGHASTVMSGERSAALAGQAPGGGGKRGWFVLGGLAIVVAGAVAIALVVTHGGHDAAPAQVTAAPGDPPAAKHGDDDPTEKMIDHEVEKTMQRIDTEVDKAWNQAGVPAPPKQTPPPPQGSGSAQQAEQTDYPTMPKPPAGGSAAAEPLVAPDGTVTRRTLAFPSFDPKDVDVTAFLAFATAEARRAIPDAVLVRADADNVDRRGHADLTLASFAAGTGSVDVRFISPRQVPPDPDKAKPFGFQWTCEFRVIAESDGVEIRDIASPCESQVRPPRCAPAAVWPRVHAKLPASAERADFDYRAGPRGAPTWYFSIRGVADDTVPDGC